MALALLSAGPTFAQPSDLVGTRARGMGGAFVAVADDASATWWNAAGIPNSFIFDGVIDLQSSQLISSQPTPVERQTPGLRTGATGVAVREGHSVIANQDETDADLVKVIPGTPDVPEHVLAVPVVVGEHLSLEDVVAATRYVETQQKTGNVVLTINGSTER